MSGSIEFNKPEYKRDGYSTIEPVIGKGVFRQGPRPAGVGFMQGGVALCNEFKGHTDNDHCRIVFVQKPAFAGASVNKVQATQNMQYTFKSSLDSPAEIAAREAKK